MKKQKNKKINFSSKEEQKFNKKKLKKLTQNKNILKRSTNKPFVQNAENNWVGVSLLAFLYKWVVCAAGKWCGVEEEWLQQARLGISNMRGLKRNKKLKHSTL